MKNGEFPEGKYTLRARSTWRAATSTCGTRCSTASGISSTTARHQWCIFPMYDFAHPIQDALEGITHSLCSLEYEDHRPLYDWVINNTDVPNKPRQIEFARLGINYTVMSSGSCASWWRRAMCPAGTTPDAHPVRPAPPGLHPRLHPQLLRPHRRGQEHLHRWSTASGALPAGGSERARPAGHGGAAPHQAHHHQLPRGGERDGGGGEQPQRPQRRDPHRVLLPEPVYRVDDFLETPIPKYKRLYPRAPSAA